MSSESSKYNNMFIPKNDTLIEKLKRETKPIVVYGMGNGADKVFSLCEENGIVITDVFASDEFVRGQSFHNFIVKTYSDIENKYGYFVILLAFAVFRDDLMNKIDKMARKHTLYVPDVPLFGKSVFTYDFFKANYDIICRAYDLMADELSRRTFADIINAKLGGSYELLRRCESDRQEVFDNIIRLTHHERYVDLGAYDGDTITEFLAQTGGRYSKITAFEPDRKNMKKLEYKYGSLDNCKLYPYASWNKDTTLNFSGNGGRMSCIDEHGGEVQAKALDNVCMNATYIKMDVEGAEYETLLGCRRLIEKSAPSLAVSAYHRAGDIFTLPLLISSLNPQYKIYLRHHKYVPAWETNLYVVG